MFIYVIYIYVYYIWITSLSVTQLSHQQRTSDGNYSTKTRSQFRCSHCVCVCVCMCACVRVCVCGVSALWLVGRPRAGGWPPKQKPFTALFARRVTWSHDSGREWQMSPGATQPARLKTLSTILRLTHTHTHTHTHTFSFLKSVLSVLHCWTCWSHRALIVCIRPSFVSIQGAEDKGQRPPPPL